MKNVFKATMLSLAIVGLAACQTTTTAVPQQQDVLTVKKDLKTTLSNYTWAYQPEGTNRPIVLTFAEDRLAVQTGCNNMGVAINITDNTLVTSQAMMTQMACSPELMQQEKFAAQLFDKRTIKVSVNTEQEQPVLSVEAANGKKYDFVGTMTPEAKYQSKAEMVFLEISPELKSCTGVAQQQCMQVREIKYNEQGVKGKTGEWELFHGQIEGFKHDPNVRTILRLKRFTLQNPAADQSKYVYIKDMAVEQEVVKTQS